jgi:hypothetical protein
MPETLTAPDTEAIVYPIADNAIAEMSKQYLPLVVKGIDDSKGLAVVHAARMKVAAKRIEIEKVRKGLKEDSLAWGRKVDSEAKRLTALLAPIETHLVAQENKIEAEKARLQKIKDDEARAKIKARVAALAEVDCHVLFEEAALLGEPEYLTLLVASKTAQREKREREAERLRVQAAEDAARKVESDRLAVERAELAKIKAAQDAEAARLAAERKRIEDADAERQRIADAEQARTEAARQPAPVPLVTAARSTGGTKTSNKNRTQARAKLLAYAEAINAVEFPILAGTSEEIEAAKVDAVDAVEVCVVSIQEIANSL